MNKIEKKLREKVLAFFNSPPQTGYGFSREENIILARWHVHKIVSEEAFEDVTGVNDNHKEYVQRENCYPFTSFGDEEFKKIGYLRFRSSTGVIIVRDILTAIALILSIYATIATILRP